MNSLTTFTSLTVSNEVLVVQSAVQSEYKNKDGTIENFYFAGKKMKKDCDWVKNQRSVLRKKNYIKKDVVKNHCIKLCNNCGEASLPIDPPPTNTSDQSECKDKDGFIKTFSQKGKVKKGKDCNWVGQRNIHELCTKKDEIKNHCIKLCDNCPGPKYLSLLPVKSSSEKWKKSSALAEVKFDLKRLTSRCSSNKQQTQVEFRFNNYVKYRSTIVRKFAIETITYAGILSSIPGLSDNQNNELYRPMLNLALMINETFIEMTPYIEGVPMRGWPFKINSIIKFDSYQGGHMMEAVALAAEQAAVHGDIDIAVSLALTVAAALHDGFLTEDIRRTKVRDDGNVVYVPAFAPTTRKERFLEVYTKMKEENKSTYEFPEEPQATNHGIATANAGIGLLRAFGAIGWLEPTTDSKLLWRLVDADGVKIKLDKYLFDLKKFVSKSADLFISICQIRYTSYTNDYSDYYTGKKGTIWYFWKYRNIKTSDCPSFTQEDSNRPEDISHARYEIRFVSLIRALGRDYFGDSNKFGIDSDDISRILVSVLNRFITDPNAKVDDRFTCDLNGETDLDLNPCKESRELPRRIISASSLLDIAVASVHTLEDRCNALTLVDAVLPIFLEDSEDFQGQFEYCQYNKYLLPLLLAKYHFYWYEKGIGECK